LSAFLHTNTSQPYSSYLPQDKAQVEFFVSRKWGDIWSITYVEWVRTFSNFLTIVEYEVYCLFWRLGLPICFVTKAVSIQNDGQIMARVTLRTAQIASHNISALSLIVITSDYVRALARRYLFFCHLCLTTLSFLQV